MSKIMPRDAGFRSDIRVKIDVDDIIRIYRGLPGDPIASTKTANLADAVLNRLNEGARLEFPGHVLNACEYFFVSSVWRIRLPSRIPHWLFDKGYIDSTGDFTTKTVEIFKAPTD